MAEGKTPDRQLHLERNKPKSQDGQPAGSESREELVDMLGGLLDKIGDLETRITDGAPDKAESEPEPAPASRRRVRKKPSEPSEPLAARRAKSVRSRIRPTRVGEDTANAEIEKFGMPDWRADISATGPEQPKDTAAGDPMVALEKENQQLVSSPSPRTAEPGSRKPPRRIVAQRIPSWAKDGYFSEDPQMAPDAEPATADPIFGIGRIADKDQADRQVQAAKATEPLTANQAEAATQPNQQPGQISHPITPIAARPEPQKPAKKPGFFGRLFGRKVEEVDEEASNFIEGGVPVRLDPKLGAETETPVPPPNVMLEPEPQAVDAPGSGPIPAEAVGGPPGMVVEAVEDLTAPRPPMAGPHTPMPPLADPAPPPPLEPEIPAEPNRDLDRQPVSDLSEDVEKLAATLETTVEESAQTAPESQETAPSAELAAAKEDSDDSKPEPAAPSFDRSFEDAPDESEAWADELDKDEAGTDGDEKRQGRAVAGFAEAPAVFEPETEDPEQPTAALEPAEPQAIEQTEEGVQQPEAETQAEARELVAEADEKPLSAVEPEPQELKEQTEALQPEPPVEGADEDRLDDADQLSPEFAEPGTSAPRASDTLEPVATRDDPTPDEEAPQEQAIEDAAGEEQVTEELASEEQVPEERVAEQHVSDEHVPEEQVAEEPAPEEHVPEEHIPEEQAPPQQPAEQPEALAEAAAPDQAEPPATDTVPVEAEEADSAERVSVAEGVSEERAEEPAAEDEPTPDVSEEPESFELPEEDPKPKLTDDVEHPFGSLVAELKAPVAEEEVERADGTDGADEPKTPASPPFEAIDDAPKIASLGPQFEEPTHFEEPDSTEPDGPEEDAKEEPVPEDTDEPQEPIAAKPTVPEPAEPESPATPAEPTEPQQPELPMEPAVAAAAMAAGAGPKSDGIVATHQRLDADAAAKTTEPDSLDDEPALDAEPMGTRESLREKAARLAAEEAESAAKKGVNWPRLGLIAAGLVVFVGGAALLGPWRGGDTPEQATQTAEAPPAESAPAESTTADTTVASGDSPQADAQAGSDSDAASEEGDSSASEQEPAVASGPETSQAPDAGNDVAALPPSQPDTADAEPGDALPLVAPASTLVTLADAPLPESASPTLLRIAQEAVSGDPLRQQDLANVYALGQQVPQNFERAVFWYMRAGENGVINAQYNLAVLTERGLGTEKDIAGAVELYRRVARQGHGPAGNALGTAYLEGKHVAQDAELAAGWFRAAAEAGEARGAMNLARLYERGLDGEPNQAAAAGWYRRAAEMGLSDGQAALDRVLASNPGIEPDIGRLPGLPADSPTALPEPEVTVDILSMTDSERTREIQRRLAELGYDPGPVDGLMGGRTRAAIEEFEQDIGRPAQGEPSNYVLAALRLASLQLDSDG